MAQLFSRFKFGQTYFVISQAVADFNFIYIIRFVFLLAFQCCISNCSTVKICMAKIVRDGEYCIEREAGEGDQLILARPPSTLIHLAKKVKKVVAELFLQR